MGLEGKSTACKFCIGCGACTALVLVVMIPVGIWVIGPKLAKKAIDDGVVRVLNNTITNCPLEPTQGQTCDFYVDMTLKNTLPLGGKLHEVNISMWNTDGDDLPSGFINGSIGYFTQPAISLKSKSTSKFQFNTSFYPNVSNAANPTLWALWTGFTSLYVMNLSLVADVKMTAFGLTYKAHFRKDLHCNCIEGSEGGGFGCNKKSDPSATVASQSQRRLSAADGVLAPASLFCEPLDVAVWDESSPGHKWQDAVSVEFAGVENPLSSLLV